MTQITVGAPDKHRTVSGRSFYPRQPRAVGVQVAPTSSQKNVIVDEFSNLPISRQRKYQLRRQRDRRCTLCGMPAVHGLRCLEHLVKDREQARKRAGYSRRYRNSITYKLQAEVSRGRGKRG